MATTSLHLAVGISAYLLLNHKLRKLKITYFTLATILPDLESLIDLVLIEYQRPVMFGILHAIIPILTIALAVSIVSQAPFGKEKSPSAFLWVTISTVLGIMIHFSMDIFSKGGVPIFAPISYTPNPFVILTSDQANIVAINASVILLATWFIMHKISRTPFLEAPSIQLMKTIEAHKELSYLTIQMKKVERYFLLIVLAIEVLAIGSYLFPPMREEIRVMVVSLTILLVIIATRLHLVP